MELKHGAVDPGNAESKKPRRFGKLNGAAVAVSAAAVAALFLFQKCEPMHEPKSVTSVCPPVVVEAADKTDGVCKPKLGEHDALLKELDPSCGFCGDGKLTEPETAETCPVDALCGNGKKDKGTYGAMVQAEAKDGTYSFGTVAVDECDEGNNFHCEADCPKQEAKRSGSGHRRIKEPTEAAPVEPPRKASQACDHSPNTKELVRVLGDNTKVGELRQLLGYDGTITARVTLPLDASGVPKGIKSISFPTCQREEAGCNEGVRTADVVSRTKINPGDATVTGAGYPCDLTVTVVYPK